MSTVRLEFNGELSRNGPDITEHGKNRQYSSNPVVAEVMAIGFVLIGRDARLLLRQRW